jgi:hypothetical protein
MKNILINILAVLAGLLIGSVVNMSLIQVSGSIIPPPEGTDNTTMEGLKEAMKLFEFKHFVFPFLAHALGTFSGALVAVLIARSHQLIFAIVIGAFFLLGGIIMTFQVPSPIWFIVVDLGFAYIPMAYLANALIKRFRN